MFINYFCISNLKVLRIWPSTKVNWPPLKKSSLEFLKSYSISKFSNFTNAYSNSQIYYIFMNIINRKVFSGPNTILFFY